MTQDDVTKAPPPSGWPEGIKEYGRYPKTPPKLRGSYPREPHKTQWGPGESKPDTSLTIDLDSGPPDVLEKF